MPKLKFSKLEEKRAKDITNTLTQMGWVETKSKSPPADITVDLSKDAEASKELIHLSSASESDESVELLEDPHRRPPRTYEKVYSKYDCLTQRSESSVSPPATKRVNVKVKKEQGTPTAIKHDSPTKKNTPELETFTPTKIRSVRYPGNYRRQSFENVNAHREQVRSGVLVSRKAVQLEDYQEARMKNLEFARHLLRFVRNVDAEIDRMKIEHPRLHYRDNTFLQAVLDMREQLMVVDVRADAMDAESLRQTFNPATVLNVAEWLREFMRNIVKKKYKLISKSNNLNERGYFIQIEWEAGGKRKTM